MLERMTGIEPAGAQLATALSTFGPSAKRSLRYSRSMPVRLQALCRAQPQRYGANDGDRTHDPPVGNRKLCR